MLGSELRAAILTLQVATIELKAKALLRDLERWYRPDQPRAPKGTPEGGQWVDDLHSGGNSGGRSRIADLTSFGTLADQIRLNDGSLLCVYDFGSQQWLLGGGPTRQIGCYAILHQSAVFPFGSRLNDNAPRR
jgi:hypothetical protein